MTNIYAALFDDNNVPVADPNANVQKTQDAHFVDKQKKATDSAPRSPEEQEVIDIIHSNDARECFGGYLFHRLGEYNWPIVSFAVEGMTAEEIEEARKHYLRFNAQCSEGFLKFCETVQQLGRYTVFNFHVAAGSRTLRQCICDNSLRMDPEVMMLKLVQLLVRYTNSLTQAQLSFYPLNCLSLDTVFIDNQRKLFVLPLFPHKGRYPIEIPREVSVGNGGNIKSDLYSAAMVSVEFYSKGNEYEVELQRPKSPIILSCLQTVNSWRPNIREVWNALNASAKNGNTNQKQDDTRPLVDEDGNIQVPSSGGSSALSGLRNMMSDAVNKVKNFRLPSLGDTESELDLGGTLQPQSNSSIIDDDSSADSADSVFDSNNFMSEV